VDCKEFKMKKPTIGFIGASHLAYVSAVAAAAKGQGIWKVISFAEHHSLDSIEEPNLDVLQTKHSGDIYFSTKIEDLQACDLVYFAIDVPTNAQGNSDLKFIADQIDLAKSHLNNNAIFVILSQVKPGFTRKIDFPKDRLFYQVETLIFGNAVERALHPERFIIGADSKKTALPKALKDYLDQFECPQFIMTYESAELAKISINMYLVSTLTTTNMLADVCQKVGADWGDIAQTLKLDKRIGPHAYLKPGLGLAGGNLERDISTIQDIALDHGSFAKSLNAQLADSQYRSDWVLRVFKGLSLPIEEIRLGVLGLSYKENTHSLKNSPSLTFLGNLDPKLTPKVFDPIVKSIAHMGHLIHVMTAKDLINKTNVLAILTPWSQFHDIDYSDFEGYIIDPYKVVKTINKAKKLYQLG